MQWIDRLALKNDSIEICIALLFLALRNWRLQIGCFLFNSKKRGFRNASFVFGVVVIGCWSTGWFNVKSGENPARKYRGYSLKILDTTPNGRVPPTRSRLAEISSITFKAKLGYQNLNLSESYHQTILRSWSSEKHPCRSLSKVNMLWHSNLLANLSNSDYIFGRTDTGLCTLFRQINPELGAQKIRLFNLRFFTCIMQVAYKWIFFRKTPGHSKYFVHFL